jgi:hypothetical protein
MVVPARSKTQALWLTLLAGSLGLHRWWLGGRGRAWALLYPLPTLLGLYGVLRMRDLGLDDRLSWLLVPLLGLTLSAAALEAILTGLTPAPQWETRHGSGTGASHWGTVLGVIVALMTGATVLLGTLAFAGQKYFEWETEPPVAALVSQGPEGPQGAQNSKVLRP